MWTYWKYLHILRATIFSCCSSYNKTGVCSCFRVSHLPIAKVVFNNSCLYLKQCPFHWVPSLRNRDFSLPLQTFMLYLPCMQIQTCICYAHTHTHILQLCPCVCTLTHTRQLNDTPSGHGVTWPITGMAVRCLLALSEWNPWKGKWRRTISAIRRKCLDMAGAEEGACMYKIVAPQ